MWLNLPPWPVIRNFGFERQFAERKGERKRERNQLSDPTILFLINYSEFLKVELDFHLLALKTQREELKDSHSRTQQHRAWGWKPKPSREVRCVLCLSLPHSAAACACLDFQQVSESSTELVMCLGHNIRRKPPNVMNVLQMSVESGNEHAK